MFVIKIKIIIGIQIVLVCRKKYFVILIVVNLIMDMFDVKLFKLLIKFIVFVIVKIYNKVSGKLNQCKLIILIIGNVIKFI